NCERVPIRLSVRPSLRYSLLGSEVAFTNGSTAMDEIFPRSPRLRATKIPAATATRPSAAPPATRYFREPPGEGALPEAAAAGATDEADLAPSAEVAGPARPVGEAAAPRTVATLPDRPESRSRFSRARSARKSAAD